MILVFICYREGLVKESRLKPEVIKIEKGQPPMWRLPFHIELALCD